MAPSIFPAQNVKEIQVTEKSCVKEFGAPWRKGTAKV